MRLCYSPASPSVARIVRGTRDFTGVSDDDIPAHNRPIQVRAPAGPPYQGFAHVPLDCDSAATP